VPCSFICSYTFLLVARRSSGSWICENAPVKPHVCLVPIMGNSASSVGGQVKKARQKLQRKVHGKRPTRRSGGGGGDAPLPGEGGRRLAVFCDVCGAIIPPGHRFLPVRSGAAPENDRDICSSCADTFTSSETQLFLNPTLLSDASLPSMEIMHRTPDTEALLNCESLRTVILRCFAAYADRPLLGILERRRRRVRGGAAEGGRDAALSTDTASDQGSFSLSMLLEKVPAARGGSSESERPGATAAKERKEQVNACMGQNRSKVQFATYSNLQRRAQWICYSLTSQLLLPEAAKCAVLCRSSNSSRKVLSWMLACVFGSFVIVLTECRASGATSKGMGSPAHARGGKDDCEGAEDVAADFEGAQILVEEGVHAVIVDPKQVACAHTHTHMYTYARAGPLAIRSEGPVTIPGPW
jgi:hypothetical protein